MSLLPLNVGDGKKGRSQTTSQPNEFLGDRLRIARSLESLTQKSLADLVASSPTMISRYERGISTPPDDLIAAFGEVLRVEDSYFSTQLVKEVKREECSFRHRQSTSKQLLDQVTARATLIHDVLFEALKIVEFPPVDIPHIELDKRTQDEIDSAAEKCRRHWNLGEGPISDMTKVVERAGIVVVKHRGHSSKVDAFSCPGEPPLIILSDITESTSRARFNLAHELGHLVLHHEIATGDTPTEREADAFSAAFSLPKDTFSQDFRVLGKRQWPALIELKRKWKSSLYSILTRAHHLDLIGTAEYRRLIKYYYWKKWNKGEPAEPPVEEPNLLQSALDIMSEDLGGIPNALRCLGWSRELIEDVLSIKVLGRSEDQADNVTSLDDWRS